MKIPFTDLKRQYLSIKNEIDEAIHRVIDLTQFILGEEVKFLVAEAAQEEVLSLPMYPELTKAQIEHITEIVKETF